ncbi:MAG: tetratricopeptide repeat protein, partial [Myxococcota bacterium]
LLLSAYDLAGREEALRDAVEQVLKDFPKGDPVLKMAIGRRDLALGRVADAIKHFRKAREQLKQRGARPRRQARAWYWIGRCHLDRGDNAPAQIALDQALSLDPSSADAHFWLGEVHSGRKRYAEAAGSFRRAVAIDPLVTEFAYHSLGETYLQLRRRKDAERAFRTYLELWPKGDLATAASDALRKLR